jgi:signal transduction histidine kinase/CheY-like chemotaxis protein/HPt (histidine-containing phosphotransfer) domain-containing protein
MLKVSLPLKVGLLITIAIGLLLAAGYLTYNSISSIIASIEVKSKPDVRLMAIREIASELDKADNSVRIYTLTRKQLDVRPYYNVLDGIDDKIIALRESSPNDNVLLAQIDTISSLIEEKMMIWNRMLNLYHTDSLDLYIRRLSAKVAVSTLNTQAPEKKILKRLFGNRKAEKAEAARLALEADSVRQTLIQDINRIEQEDSLKQTKLLMTESMLATTGNEIRDRLYTLISRMENEVDLSISNNKESARQLAMVTYRRLALYAAVGSLLAAILLFLVVRYVRKTREVQKALEKSKEETEQLARTKELFMANMSHEIRTPVNAIYGFASELLYEPLGESSKRMAGIIKSSADHLSQIVNDILDFSKLQNSKIQLENVHYRIGSLCDELRLLFEKKAAEKNTVLIFDIHPSTPDVLYGDAYRLRQILLNLIGNAVKFTSGGEVRIGVEADEMKGHDFTLKIFVRDTGIGISKEMQSRVFDDFTQAEAGTSRKYGGTGLGLSIVKKLVELHQGTLSLESIEGLGTTITFRLPCQTGNREMITQSAGITEIPVYLKKLKYLIVDDEEYNRLLFKTILNRWGATYYEAENGSKAIEILVSEKIDLVFMDARMPVMDGLKATETIRKELGKGRDELPVIAISATHTSDDLGKYNRAGMNTFMPKPFTEKILLETIVSVIGERAAWEEEVAVAAAVAGGEKAETAGEEAVINLESLYHLANNDLAFVRQLLVTFIESTAQGLENLAAAVEKADEKTAGEIAHKISSPCRHLGASLLYGQLKSIEELAQRHENMAILAELSAKTLREFQKIRKELEEHLAKMEE